VCNGPVELQAQFLQGDLALPIELALEQSKGMKQVEGQQRNQQTGQDRSRIMMGAVPQVPVLDQCVEGVVLDPPPTVPQIPG
jgi:hypothetical protein